MKQLVFQFLLPFLVSLLLAFIIVSHTVWLPGFEHHAAVTRSTSFDFIDNFNDNPGYENQFLLPDSTRDNIFLVGSSELTASTPAIPYLFISSRFSTHVRSVGHAGNQCLSIFTQLLANYNRLNHAPVAFIISPGWFESKPTKGTSSEVFLEFNSERFLENINRDTSGQNAPFREYCGKRVADLYSEFNSPNLQLKLMNSRYRASKSPIHKLAFAPLISMDEFLISQKENLAPPNNTNKSVDHLPIIPEAVEINWDSLFSVSKSEAAKRSTNNTEGIDNDFYTKYIHGGKGRIDPVKPEHNQELEDFEMLIRLVRASHMNACFIISPLNPLHFKNLNVLSPTINTVKDEITNNGFPCLNLFEADTIKYEKALLHDVMHMSDYGWYRVDQFIVNIYHLSK